MANTIDDEQPFLFPLRKSKVLPDPSKFFSKNLLASPLPTNSFFQNFVLGNGNIQEYIHPYLIKPADSSLSLCYPFLSVSSHSMHQVFTPDLTISSSKGSQSRHVISSFSDLSVTLEFPSSNLTFFLVRGSPYVTVSLSQHESLSITSIHKISSFSSNASPIKYTLQLHNGQKWLIYTSSPTIFCFSLDMKLTFFNISSDEAPVIVRIAVMPDSSSKREVVLDRYSFCYPVSGEAIFTKPYCVEYKWEKKGLGNLLMLAHPLHLQLLSKDEGNVSVLKHFKYRSIDGGLVGVVGDSWMLEAEYVPVTWHSARGVNQDSYDEIKQALCRDVGALCSSKIATTSAFYYGKSIARAARFALIAEEVGILDLISLVKKFLKETIQPWLDGTFEGNGFLYEKQWGGLITKQGADSSGAEYDSHHVQLGHFVYGIAVLAKIDPNWGKKYRSEAYSLMEDFMNLGGKDSKSKYTRLRCFDLFMLHSWDSGLEYSDVGRYQLNSGQAVNAYYSAALMGLAYNDANLVAIGSTLAALEIHAAQMWRQLKRDDKKCVDFTKENRLMEVLWSNQRSRGFWIGFPGLEVHALGIHVLPLLPISEFLFSNVGFVKEVVEWTMPCLNRDGVGEIWKGLVYAMEGIYDNEAALKKVGELSSFDDARSSLSNLLWWLHSRRGQEDHHQDSCNDENSVSILKI
ncbi:glucan endo-1,3-beta-D-glucosidase ARB_01444-like [Arachis stenosperma]|uniref:glucan endo-1,3-beta-D-glucosidase ARB_01444-like n=1 Tax=Arachis stenosperma TaxID=217475 RepID=UPI0025AC112F|nr:glucan endo-1,3-beta-D-glucosidase ARB_01444-like [Arachis stenosperma]